jgi:diadenosine hexaphosphate hydrolase (ATP-forming)
MTIDPFAGAPIMENPTHAGGIVVRGHGDDLRILLVTATRQAHQWVFPKGHIEPGETPEQAAAREVEEEAGVIAAVGQPIGTLEFRNARGLVRAQFYLMTFVSEGPPREGRRRGWFTVEEARQALGYEDSRMLVLRAARIAEGSRGL